MKHDLESINILRETIKGEDTRNEYLSELVRRCMGSGERGGALRNENGEDWLYID